MKNQELRDKIDQFELPLRKGGWEAIEPKIPHYKKKRKLIPFYWFSSFLIISGCFALYFTTIFKNDYNNNNAQNNDTLNRKVELERNKRNEINSKSLFNDDVDLVINNNNKNKVINSNKKQKIKSYFNAKSGFNSNNINNNNILLKTTKLSDKINTPEAYQKIEKALNTESYHTNYDRFYLLPLKYLKIKSWQNSINEEKVAKLKKSPKYYVGIGYSNLSSSFVLNPSLMKLPKGRGNEVEISFGKMSEKWKFGTNINYSSVNQTTTMPGKFDTLYRNSFRSDFKTITPQEYVYKIHDTTKLILPGSNHNSINQKFVTIGFGLNTQYNVFNFKKWSADIGYGFNYKLLVKASTFFWDSVNNFAIPFNEKDEGLVFHHLLTSRVNFGINYAFHSKWTVQISPFYEHFHTAIVKHYYKAKFHNSGLRFNLFYRF